MNEEEIQAAYAEPSRNDYGPWEAQKMMNEFLQIVAQDSNETGDKEGEGERSGK